VKTHIVKSATGGTFDQWLHAVPRDKSQQITVTLQIDRNDIGVVLQVMLQQQATFEAVINHVLSENIDALTGQPALSGVYGTALKSQGGTV
jgi:hypothetical protein